MLCCWFDAYAFKCAHSSNGDPILCYINGHQQDRQPIPWREMSFILRLKKLCYYDTSQRKIYRIQFVDNDRKKKHHR